MERLAAALEALGVAQVGVAVHGGASPAQGDGVVCQQGRADLAGAEIHVLQPLTSPHPHRGIVPAREPHPVAPRHVEVGAGERSGLRIRNHGQKSSPLLTAELSCLPAASPLEGLEAGSPSYPLPDCRRRRRHQDSVADAGLGYEHVELVVEGEVVSQPDGVVKHSVVADVDACYRPRAC
eukprot:760482-Hanusia_phi.AAC.9